MIPEQIKDNQLDKVIRNVLASNDDLTVPTGLPDKIVRIIEKKVLLRELILELSFKTGIILGSLTILAGVFVWMNGTDVLNNLYTQFTDNWQIITSLLLLVLITTLIDQVGLKFYSRT